MGISAVEADEVLVRAIIGHEKKGDDAKEPEAVKSVTAEDVANFRAGRLDLIKIDISAHGSSYQDLLLSWIGYRFGQKVGNGAFKTKEEAARWLTMMLTNVDLSKIPPTDPFYADAVKVNAMIDQVRKLPAHREVR